MKKTPGILTMAVSATFLALSSLMISCDKSSDDAISTQASTTATNESTQDAQQDEVDDIAANQMGNVDSPTGRVEGKFKFDDYRCSCATITHQNDTIKGSGMITIDFGTGCTDKYGNVRTGKIMISWTDGRWFVTGSTYVITFSGYSINEVKFSDNDIRTLHNIGTTEQPLMWTVVATHDLTWPDNTTAHRAVHKTREWVRSADILGDKFIVSQTSSDVAAAVGTNRHGVAYSVAITVPIEYDRSCAILNRVFKPVKGTKVITYDNGKIATIDFGDGTCDKVYTVTADGKTKTFNAKNDSSAD